MKRNLKNCRILIVDDQIANIDMLEGFLEMEGYSDVRSTNDPRQVMDIIREYNPDLLLLDLMMPHISGYEILEMIGTRSGPEDFLPILVLTADITNEAKRKALTLGASDFLTKPFDLVEVGLRIDNLLLTRYLLNQLADQNRILDEKVKERTLELMQRNSELVEARDKAEAGDRLKTAFLRNISHEVRTPLNGILGFSKLIADSHPPDSDAREFVKYLELSSNRLMNTITDYIDISLIVSSTLDCSKRVVSIIPVFEDLKSKSQTASLTKGLEFEFSFDENCRNQYVNTDGELLAKVCSHLIDNAIKFTSRGSVRVFCSLDKDSLVFRVSDTGVGIDPEARERIFEPFMQENISTNRGYEGSGLGLTIVAGLLKVLGGHLTLESEKGKGSVFTARIPHGMEGMSIPEAPKAADRFLSPVLLVAEDDPANLEFIDMVLRKFALKVYTAENGKEALDLCSEHKDISVVLMDIKMPVMDGLEATRRIKEIRPDLPVLALTAFVMSGDEQNAREAGCDDFISKPVSPSVLISKLKSYLSIE
jgi:CheY-like chemotaxis protein